MARGFVAGTMLGMAMCVASPALADTAREVLTQASYAEKTKAGALQRISAAEALANATLQRSPADREALLMRASAIGYRAKLTGNRRDAIASRKLFEALVAREPGFADAQLALGAWHVGAVFNLGKLVARAAVGGQRPAGFAALDRAVAMGGNRAIYPGLAALLRLELDPRDPRGRELAEIATRANVVTPLDRLMQRACTAVLPLIRAGKKDDTARMASRLLPFGRIDD